MEIDNRGRLALESATPTLRNGHAEVAGTPDGPTMWRAGNVPADSRVIRVTTTATPEQLARFGCRDGTAIANKDRLLDDIWRTLGSKPKLIYGLAELGSDYGHAFCAFEAPHPTTGKPTFMVPNIVGVPGEKMVQWIELTEYLFGVSEFKGANRQRGVYNRPFTLVTIDDPKIDVQAVKHYFDDLAARNQAGTAKFSLVFPRILNVVTAPLRWLGLSKTEYGNCARWNYEAMKAGNIFSKEITLANFFTHNTMWPKRTAVRLLDGLAKVKAGAVVYLPRPEHAKVTARGKSEGRTYVNVFTRIADFLGLVTARGRHYASLENLANVVVRVPDQTIEAQLETHTPKLLAAA